MTLSRVTTASGAIAAAACALVLAISGANSAILADWWLENLVIAAFFLALAWNRNRLPIGPASYWLLFLLLCLHEYGAAHAYATPLGEWMRQWTGPERNSYDRLVHFLYGLLATPAFRDLARASAWQNVMATSAIYEILEWLVAATVDPSLGKEFVGAQGDDFDAAKDMALAGLGSLTTLAAIYFRNSIVSRTNSSN